MKPVYKFGAMAVLVVTAAVAATSFLAGQTPSSGDRLIVYGDIVYFFGVGKPATARRIATSNGAIRWASG